MNIFKISEENFRKLNEHCQRCGGILQKEIMKKIKTSEENFKTNHESVQRFRGRFPNKS